MSFKTILLTLLALALIHTAPAAPPKKLTIAVIPKGTSVVTQEFSPGKHVPSSIDSMRQFTVDSARNTLDHMEKKHDERTVVFSCVSPLPRKAAQSPGIARGAL